MAGNDPLQRTSAKLRVLVLDQEPFSGVGFNNELDVLALGQLFFPFEHQIQDRGKLLGRELVKQDDLVQSVNELRVKNAFYLVQDQVRRFLGSFIGSVLRLRRVEVECAPVTRTATVRDPCRPPAQIGRGREAPQRPWPEAGRGSG